LITVVNGLLAHEEKIESLQELVGFKGVVVDAWMILGVVNLICSAMDMSNNNLNYRMVRRFRNTIDDLELKEIPFCKGRIT
jgi:hypothetical protein